MKQKQIKRLRFKFYEGEVKTKSYIRAHVIWSLIVANLIIGFLTVQKMENFYKDYAKLETKQAEAKEITLQEDPYTWVQRQWEDAGADWIKVWAIVQCESGWNQEAAGVNTNGTIDRGLYQLNSIHNINPSCAFNLECSTKEAIKMWQEQKFDPWVCSRKLGII